MPLTAEQRGTVSIALIHSYLQNSPRKFQIACRLLQQDIAHVDRQIADAAKDAKQLVEETR